MMAPITAPPTATRWYCGRSTPARVATVPSPGARALKSPQRDHGTFGFRQHRRQGFQFTELQYRSRGSTSARKCAVNTVSSGAPSGCSRTSSTGRNMARLSPGVRVRPSGPIA